MKKFVLYLVTLVMIGWSCTKKKYPASYAENAPVFYFKANINAVPVEFNAGVNNYRMFASYKLDSNNVYQLLAEMKPKDCAGNCAGSIKIQVNDYTVSASGSGMMIDSALRIGPYAYINNTAGSSYEVFFVSQVNKTAESYLWDFGDGKTSTLVNPSHVYQQSGTYQVCLQVKGTNGYESKVCHNINLGAMAQLNSYVKVNTLIGDSVIFDQVRSGGYTPFDYVWDFGDGAQSTAASPTHKYKISGSYPVSLKVKDIAGNTVQTNYNFVSQKDKSSFAANYQSDIVREIKSSSAPSKISVTYVDEQGVVYNSAKSDQPGASNFQILEVSNYDMNENNQSTKKLKIKFNCVVYNANSSITISNAEAVIAVAYK